jgi:hypothetical protein
MQLGSKEHYDLMDQFEREFKQDFRLDREKDREWWRQGHCYENGEASKAFNAYIRGYSLGKAVEREPAVESGVDGWLPIESAPKDGSVILLTGLIYGVGPDRFYVEAEWMDGHFYDVNDADKDMLATPYLTHWQPLPPAPTAVQQPEDE